MRLLCFLLILFLAFVSLVGCQVDSIGSEWNYEMEFNTQTENTEITESETAFYERLDETTSETEVTDTYEDLDREATAETAVIPVALKVNAEHVPKEYLLNAVTDFSGLVVSVVYNTGEMRELGHDKFTVGCVDMSTCGVKEVVVSHNGFSDSFVIHVSFAVEECEPHVKYTSVILNLRNGPGPEFDLLLSVPKNTALSVVGRVDNGWVKVIYQGNEYFCAGNYLIDEETAFNSDKGNEDLSVMDSVSYGPVVGESEACSAVAQHAYSYWEQCVPAWLKEKFLSSGWKIIVSKIPLNQRFGYSVSLAGMTVYNEATIFLDNRLSVVAHILIHELGHFVDYINYFPSYDNEFHEIYEAEKHLYTDVSGVGDNHNVSNEQEFFASVFRDIIVNGVETIGNIPLTYAFISKYLCA